jgi:hypothetical protein
MARLDGCGNSRPRWDSIPGPSYTDGFVPAHIDHYVPERHHVCRAYSFAAILYLQFMLHAVLCPVFNVL